MNQITLAEAAKAVLLTIAPLIAAGALAKMGEDLSDTATATRAHTWDAVAAHVKRKLTTSEQTALAQGAAVVERRLAAQPKAARALDYFRADPEDADAQRIVEAQIVAVFQTAPEELIAIARTIAALQPAAPPPAGARIVNVSGGGQVGIVSQGDITGNLTLGPVDFSRNKRIASPDLASSPGAQRPSADAPPVTRQAPLPATLSADGIHFSAGHALIIGVGSYQDPHIRNVTSTAADARALGALLRDPQLAAYPSEQVQVLVDAKATRANILDALEALAQRAAGGTALICFAGHGEPVGTSYALLPYDADMHRLAETALTAEVFHQRVAQIRKRANRLVVLLNCCHAGGVGDTVLGGEADVAGGTAPPPEFYRPLAVGSGQVVISSSRPSQKSGARSQVNPQHTTFGTHLLDALRGKAPGQGPGVGIFELFAYLRAHVPTDAQHIAYQGKPLVQEPLFYASQLDDNLAVALRPGWQGGTLGTDLAQQVSRLIELELQQEAETVDDPALREELKRLLAALNM